MKASEWNSYVERRMAKHRAWQEREAERLTEELWEDVFGKGPQLRAVQNQQALHLKAYRGLSVSTIEVLKDLGK